MQFATHNLQHAICNMQFATWFATCNLQHDFQDAICMMQFARCNLLDAIYMMQFVWCNLRDAIFMMQFAWCNLHDAISMMQSARCNFQDAIWMMQIARCTLKDAICKMQFARCNVARCNVARCNVVMLQSCNIATLQCNGYIAVCASSHSSGSLERGCPSSAEVIEDTEDFLYYSGFYSLFSVPTDL